MIFTTSMSDVVDGRFKSVKMPLNLLERLNILLNNFLNDFHTFRLEKVPFLNNKEILGIIVLIITIYRCVCGFATPPFPLDVT